MNPNPHPALNRVNSAGFRWDFILAYVNGGYWIDDQWLLQGPNVVHALIEPEASTQATGHPHLAILHSNAAPKLTKWEALVAYWRRKDITGEAHFIPGFEQMVQTMPLNRRADCNYKANWFRKPGVTTPLIAISFETQDMGAATLPTTPWNMVQLNDMVGGLTAICVVAGMSCTAPATWNDSGIGHHALFKEWSVYTGKTCPGAARIRQMDWVRGEVAKRLGDFMQFTDREWTCGTGAAK